MGADDASNPAGACSAALALDVHPGTPAGVAAVPASRPIRASPRPGGDDSGLDE